MLKYCVSNNYYQLEHPKPPTFLLMKYTLRDYQEECKSQIREKLRSGKRKIIAHLATGAGKGLLMSDLNLSAQINGKKVFNLMRRKSLITQTQKNYKKYHGINSSIIMGHHQGYNSNMAIQIGSIDTIIRRMGRPEFQYLSGYDLCIVDEMQDSTSDGYQKVFDWMGEKIFIGFSATPYNVGRKGHTFWDDVVKPIEMYELRDQGFLVPDQTMTPKAIDIRGIKKVAGDFHNRDLAERASGSQIVGDIVECYKKYGSNKPAILFACNINHSKIMAEAFKEAGISAMHCDQETPEAERQNVIEMSRQGLIKVVCNVNIFSTGVDMPWLEVGIMARPTMSTILYCQQAGRLLRPYKICGNCGSEYGGDPRCLHCGSSKLSYNKEFALFLDHANNTERHGLIYESRDACLKDKEGSESFKPSVKQCPGCFSWMEKSKSVCPFCAYSYMENKEERDRIIEVIDGELELVDMGEVVRKKYATLVKQGRYMGWDQHKVVSMLYKKFGGVIFQHIRVPETLARKVQVECVLSSASKISRRNNSGNPKGVW